MKGVFLLFLFSFGTLFELFWGQLMLPPLLALSLLTLYFSYSLSVGAVFLPALTAGLVLDLCFNRPYPLSGPILLLAGLTGLLIRRKTPEHPLETALPGLGSILAALLVGALARHLMSSGQPDPWDLFWQMLFWGTLAIAVTPVFTLLFDAASQLLGFEGAVRQQKSVPGGRLRPRRIRESAKGKAR